MWYHSRSGLSQATANHRACVRTLPAPPTLPCSPVDWAAGEVFLFPLCREGSLGSVRLSVLPELPSMCCDLGCITLPMLQFPLPERAQVPSLPLHVDIPGDRGHTGAVGFLGPVSPLVPSSEPSSLVWPSTACLIIHCIPSAVSASWWFLNAHFLNVRTCCPCSQVQVS